MTANERQIGGAHYKGNYQHWDLVHHLDLPYLPAQITRYIARWRKKNGIEDLEKALHYMDKYMENESKRRCYHHERMKKFLRDNWLKEHEQRVFNILIDYQLGDEDRLLEARSAIADLIEIVKGNKPVDPEFRDQRDEWKNN